MKHLKNISMFVLGAAAGAGAYMGLESLNQNKYQVKKKINDTIDQVSSTMK